MFLQGRGRDSIPQPSHQILIIEKVVQRVQARAQDLVALIQMSQLRSPW